MLVEGEGLRVLVVGGGAVATRKVAQFVNAGARVRIVAIAVCQELEELALSRSLQVERRMYDAPDIADAQVVVAATNDSAVNARVARDCDSLHRLLNAAETSAGGNLTMMAAHRRGPLAIGVSAGGVPAAATRIRDAIAERFDARYGDALTELSALRARLVSAGQGAQWRDRSAALIDERFCDAVEGGTLGESMARWP